jgi:hypothetical protein
VKLAELEKELSAISANWTSEDPALSDDTVVER